MTVEVTRTTVTRRPWIVIDGPYTKIVLTRNTTASLPIPGGSVLLSIGNSRFPDNDDGWTGSITQEQAEELIVALQLIVEGNKQEKDLI